MRQILAKVLALVGLCGVFVVSWNCTKEGTFHALDCEPRDISFGEVVVGSVTEQTFQVENPSDLYTNHLSGPSAYPTSTVRVNGFSISECDALGVPFSIEGTFPFDLDNDESSDLSVEFAPTVVGDWACEAIPGYSIIDVDANTAPEDFFHSCTINLTGSTASAPEPVCAVQPSTAEVDFGEVEAGTSRADTLTIRNETLDALATNQFRFLFDGPSSDCSLFTIDPADTVGVLGPGESKEITVRFEPDAAGSFECSRSLSSLKEPADAASPYITNACPAEVIWRGTGVEAPLAWSDCSQAGFDYDLNGLYGLSENEIYLAGVLGNVLRSDGSCDWGLAGTPFAEVNLTDIWAYSTASDTAIWAVGNLASNSTTGAILRSDGSTWEKVDEGWMVHYGAVWGSALDDVYFVGTGVSTDLANTKHWNGTIVDTLTIDMGWTELTSVHGTAGDDVWAVVQQSLMSNSVYRFQGTTWENQTLPFTPNPLHDVWAVQVTGGPYALYAVGEDGGIYHFDGATWSDESIAGETDDFYGVWVSETGQAWVVGQNGAIYHKSGANWTLQNPPAGLERDLHDVWGSSDENVFAVGASGLILRYTR